MKKDTFTVTNLEQTLEIFKSRAHELRTMNNVTTPEGLLQRVDQDCEVLKFITMEKLPAEIDVRSKEIFAMQLVAENPPECVSDLGSIEEKVSNKYFVSQGECLIRFPIHPIIFWAKSRT